LIHNDPTFKEHQPLKARVMDADVISAGLLMPTQGSPFAIYAKSLFALGVFSGPRIQELRFISQSDVVAHSTFASDNCIRYTLSFLSWTIYVKCVFSFSDKYCGYV
jgi:hypothetical protein